MKSPNKKSRDTKPAIIMILTVCICSSLLSTYAIAEKGHFIPKPKNSQTLWDSWYTVTLLPKTHYGYYNDSVLKVGDKIAYKNHFWKKEEGFINEEALAAFAEPKTLKPAFFNFHSQYRANEVMIDGTVLDENKLTVSVRQGETSNAPIHRSIPKNVFFSSFFPVWIKENTENMKVGETKNYMTLLEDAANQDFSPVSGTAKLEPDDDYSKINHAKKFKVHYREQDSVWYFDTKGMPLRILMLSQKVVVEKTSKEVAEKFLKNAP